MSDAGAPLVSVVVVNFNGRRHLERCLPALAATTGVEFEVIVVDNGSGDGSVEWLARDWPQVKALALATNLGFGAANGRGVAEAGAEFVALLNNDTVVAPGWLAALLEPLCADPRIAASCATLRFLQFPEVLNARGGAMTSAGYGYDIDFMVPAQRPPADEAAARWRDVLFPTAAAMLMRRSDFIDVGGFDPRMFMYHEDVDLGLRLWLRGRRVVVCEAAVVGHAWGGTSHDARGLRWRERLGMRHNVRTILKCYRPINVLRVAKRISKIWWAHRAFGQAAAVCGWNLVHLPSTLAERRHVQRRKKVSEGELYLRGLITGGAWPPDPPLPPAPEDGRRDPDLIPTPTLLPGEHSALGRLGAGWYRVEKLAGRRIRWTTGVAFCTLRVAPRATGRLEVEMSFGPDAEDATADIECNGATAEAAIGEAWRTASVRTAADADGLLRVRISSRLWVPHFRLASWDFRTLGCAVRSVRFHADEPPRISAEPRVSVIVPTFNRWPILERALDALAAQSYRNFEAIVVDDGSTDGTWERLLAWQRSNAGRLDLKPLHQENLKPGRARNLGLRSAAGDLVLFLGDDIIAAPELVAEHVGAHLRIGEPVGILGFTDWDRRAVRVTPFLELVNRDGQQFSYGHFKDGEDMFFTCFYTSNISLPRDALGEDPFHPAFTFVDWEDTELGYRLARRGLRLVLHTAAKAVHVHPMTMAGFLRRQRHVGRTVGVILGLHPELAASDAMPPLDPSRWVPLARPAVAAGAPLLSFLDGLGVPFPARLYRMALLTAFFSGRAQAAKDGATP